MKVKIKPHPYFRRDQFDIFTTNFITVSQAVLGGKIKVKTLYGDVNVAIEPGTNDGDQKTMSNYVNYLNKQKRVYQNYHQIKTQKGFIPYNLK